MSLSKKKIKVYFVDVKATSFEVYKHLVESKNFRKWFPDSDIVYKDKQNLKNLAYLRLNNIKDLFVIEDYIVNQKISGIIKSTNVDDEPQSFSFVLTPSDIPNWTHISLTVQIRLQKHKAWPLLSISPTSILMSEIFRNIEETLTTSSTSASTSIRPSHVDTVTSYVSTASNPSLKRWKSKK